MAKTPFKMKYKGSSFPFKTSPAKGTPSDTHTHPHVDDTYLTDTETGTEGKVTSTRLSTIDARLNKLRNVDTSAMNRGDLKKHGENLKLGQAARENEMARIKAVRS